MIKDGDSDGHLVEHALYELLHAGLFESDSDYGGMIGVAVMELIRLFASQSHSGFSAEMTIHIFRELASFRSLTPLTDDPNEWMEVTDGLWQSRRESSSFSYDGGKTYHTNADPDTTITAVDHTKENIDESE